MIHLNVVAQLSLTKCVLPHMIERRRGHIVITSSLAGKAGTYSDFSGTSSNSGFYIYMEFKSAVVLVICPFNVDHIKH